MTAPTARPSRKPFPSSPRRPRPDLSGPGLYRFIEHQAVRTPALIRAAFITGAIQPTFYFLVLGLGLGTLISANDSSNLEGGYLQYVGPGLLAASAIQWAFQEGLWPTSESLRWARTYSGSATTPTTIDEIAVGHSLWIAIRFTVAAVFYTLVLVAFGVTKSWLAVFAPLAAGLTVLSSVGWVSGFVARDDNDSHYPLVLRLVLFPMFMFSGAFFPLDTMPAGVGFVASMLPAYHGVELSRAVITGETAGMGIHLGYLTVVGLAGLVFQFGGFRAILEGDRR